MLLKAAHLPMHLDSTFSEIDKSQAHVLKLAGMLPLKLLLSSCSCAR